MLKYQASVAIDADLAIVWALLVDGAGYPSWEPGIERIDGEITLGNKITVHTRASERAFPVKVVSMLPGRRMVWSGGMPLGLFKAERAFVLTPLPQGGTLFYTQESFTGPLLGLISKSMPDLTEDFERFAQGLKAAAEEPSRQVPKAA